MSDYLQLESLTLAYGKSVAVESLNLSVSQGELVAFLGPSGCGKSTTMRAIAGLMKTRSGHIRLDGQDITRKPPNKRDVGMVFQSYALFPHLSVTENVAFGLRLKRLPEQEITSRVNEGLSMVGLDEFAQRMPAELSGGQQQRVALARALVMDPKVLLLDEPLSNLDARLRLEMRNELQRVQRETGLTMIFVTHDQVEALSLADRIVVMNQGRIEQIGTPEEIHDKPATRFVADFVGFENIIPADGSYPLTRYLANNVESVAWRPAGVVLGSGVHRGKIIGKAFAGTTREYLLETCFGPLRADVAAELPAYDTGAQVAFDLPLEKAVKLTGSKESTMKITRNLWVDTDMGFDDMHALLVLRHQGIKPVAQSLVFGCTQLSQVLNNAQGFNELFNGGGPWHIGEAKALDGSLRTATDILGDSGLLTRGIPFPQGPLLPQASMSTAALIQWLETDPEQPEILALGPLTNIALLIQQAPELARRIVRLTWMGGSTGMGNQTRYGEFNAWADARAAATVFESGIRVQMVDLEVCRQIQLVPDDLIALAKVGSPVGNLLHDLLGGYLDIGLSRGRSGMAIYDPVAAASLIVSDAFDVRPVSIRVETQNEECEGQTIVSPPDSDDPVHTVLTINDVPRVKNAIMAALLAAAEQED